MSFQIKKTIGWISVIISTITFVFYLEGFIFYSFKANYGFLLSFFIAPIGVIIGYISRNEGRVVKVFGLYGNIVAFTFGFLYWPMGDRLLHFIKLYSNVPLFVLLITICRYLIAVWRTS